MKYFRSSSGHWLSIGIQYDWQQLLAFFINGLFRYHLVPRSALLLPLMVEYVYARYDFVPENEDEISFCAGERIEVVEKDDIYQDGWWKVRSHSPVVN